METTYKFSPLSRLLLVMSALCLIVSIFVPIWRIDLDAPQYPEGLRLLIYSDKLGGNVDIINGLNHYIGMRTLHAEEFIEFTVLPYIIGGFALFALIVAVAGKRKLLYALLSCFILFGIVAMVDFWRWEYDYGHNLDPNAAIIVPGMAYQPPLIGFKQLLNFGAYSIPDVGGWLFIASGILMVAAAILEYRGVKKLSRTGSYAALVVAGMFSSCAPKAPEAVKLNSDACDFCKMTISDGRFAAQMITNKGRVYKFDDLSCMQNYVREEPARKESRLFIADFNKPAEFLEVEKASYVSGEGVGSPMGGNTAAFSDEASANSYAQKINGAVLNWGDIGK